MLNAEIIAPPAGAADIFAALGDPTRLRLFEALCDGGARSIADLSGVAPITRQGLTKHLQTLERAGILASRRAGRENRFVIRPEAVNDARAYLDAAARQWEAALGRLKDHVESGA